jgi:hypothetical protein
MVEYHSNPISLVLPKVTKAVRDTLKPQVGSVYWVSDLSKVSVCRVASVGSTAWTNS